MYTAAHTDQIIRSKVSSHPFISFGRSSGCHHPFETFLRSFALPNLQITFHNLDQSNFELSSAHEKFDV